MYVYTYTYLRMCMNENTNIYIYIYMHIHRYVYTYVYTYIYKYKHKSIYLQNYHYENCYHHHLSCYSDPHLMHCWMNYFHFFYLLSFLYQILFYSLFSAYLYIIYLNLVCHWRVAWIVILACLDIRFMYRNLDIRFMWYIYMIYVHYV
jgi:hypothetical protein